jgi:hypothetical protein
MHTEAGANDTVYGMEPNIEAEIQADGAEYRRRHDANIFQI